MSATFKNAKKKLSQTQLRKYMNEHKSKDKEVKKIQSPLAKYNESGQLTCVLCQSVVRSETVWTVHVNAKQHKQNVEQAKKLKERTNNFTVPLKRPLTPPLPEIPDKKVKGILKNGTSNVATVINKDGGAIGDAEVSKSKLPDDFFDSKSKPNVGNPQLSGAKERNGKEVELLPDKDVLPEGFFDDPKLDAKARNQEYKDPVEEEWEKFMKEIKEADSKSNAIIAEDQEESTMERQIDEINEQMKKLSRVLDLEKKKDEVISITSESKNVESTVVEDDVAVDDFDEFLDWRSKKSFK